MILKTIMIRLLLGEKILYLFFDFISAGSSWILFNYFRKTYIEKYDFEGRVIRAGYRY